MHFAIRAGYRAVMETFKQTGICCTINSVCLLFFWELQDIDCIMKNRNEGGAECRKNVYMQRLSWRMAK